MKRMLPLLLVGMLLMGGCGAQQEKTPERFEKRYYNLFGTEISLIAYTEGQEEFDTLAGLVGQELERLHQLYDIYDTYEGINNLKTVNDQAGIEPVAVSEDILDLLELSVWACEETGGMVNVAMGSVLSIWHDYREAGLDNPAQAQVPSYEMLEAAARHTDIANLQIDRLAGTAYLTDPAMSLDVGAVAKGYAAQLTVNLAKAYGYDSLILNAGGNVCVLGTPRDGRDTWGVGIQSPQLGAAGEQTLYGSIRTAGENSVVTSGNYQRYYLVDGAAYHHIIDPVTLYPGEQAAAVTVVHPDSGIADILSTAIFLLPYEEGVALVQRHNAQALWLWPDGTEAATVGMWELLG